VESITQPDWDGTGTDVYYDSSLGGLILDSENDLYDVTDLYEAGDLYVNGSLVSEGTYTLDDYIDLGDIYTVRALAELTISSSDLYSDLYDVEDLYDLTNLYGAPDGSCSASLEIRTTDDDPSGTPTWTDWKPFLVGDYTGRAFDFRLRLRGTQPSLTPIVEEVYVELDMEDRTYGFSATVGVAGATVTFSPAFYTTPEIGISVNDGQEGDKYTISNKDETGFEIAFTNSGNPVERNISGIAKAYGYLET